MTGASAGSWRRATIHGFRRTIHGEKRQFMEPEGPPVAEVSTSAENAVKGV